MANYFDRIPAVPLVGWPAAVTKSGLALDSNYVYATSGDAVAVRFMSPVATASNLTKVYFFMSAHGGTPGNLTVELRNWNTTNNLRPGTTLHASQTDVSPGTTDNKWIVCTFGTPFACQPSTPYWVVIGDAAGDGTNYATIAYLGGLTGLTTTLFAEFESMRTTGGFAADGSSGGATIPMVLVFADGTILGSPYDTATNDSSNTLERGIKIVGLTEKLIVSGVIFNANASINGVKIYSGATIPGGTTDLTVSAGAGAGAMGVIRFAPFTMLKSTVYRVVLTYASNAIGPGYFNNEDGAAQADTLASQIAGGNIYRCISDGGTPAAWVDTGTNLCERVALIVEDQVAITGGGGMLQANKRGNKL